jgi:hypothetical protein
VHGVHARTSVNIPRSVGIDPPIRTGRKFDISGLLWTFRSRHWSEFCKGRGRPRHGDARVHDVDWTSMSLYFIR